MCSTTIGTPNIRRWFLRNQKCHERRRCVWGRCLRAWLWRSMWGETWGLGLVLRLGIGEVPGEECREECGGHEHFNFQWPTLPQLTHLVLCLLRSLILVVRCCHCLRVRYGCGVATLPLKPNFLSDVCVVCGGLCEFDERWAKNPCISRTVIKSSTRFRIWCSSSRSLCFNLSTCQLIQFNILLKKIFTTYNRPESLIVQMIYMIYDIWQQHSSML